MIEKIITKCEHVAVFVLFPNASVESNSFGEFINADSFPDLVEAFPLDLIAYSWSPTKREPFNSPMFCVETISSACNNTITDCTNSPSVEDHR